MKSDPGSHQLLPESRWETGCVDIPSVSSVCSPTFASTAVLMVTPEVSARRIHQGPAPPADKKRCAFAHRPAPPRSLHLVSAGTMPASVGRDLDNRLDFSILITANIPLHSFTSAAHMHLH
ncbi:hypothetical protein GOODEAATRI_012160 [Goodea atripinnis]|uniref:Uncharacterized protein n=1 Tax=Goodea atripinnis TaxID=208336 RepID=A0ABV0MRG0_9TELE